MNEPINNMECLSVFRKDTKEVLVNHWTLTLTPATVATFSETVLVYVETELMAGSRIELPDGRTEFRFDLDDEKTQEFKRALYQCVYPISDN